MFVIKGKSGIITNQQGDVPLVPVSLAFAGTNEAKNGRAILAFGEATGHAHVIDSPRVHLTRDADVIAALKRELVEKGILHPDADTIDAGLIVEGGDAVMLRHDEHEAHTIAPGRYAVLRQREYAPEAIRRVED